MNYGPFAESDLINRYLDVLKKSLLNELYIENEAKIIYAIKSIVDNEKLDLTRLFDTNLDKELLNKLTQIKQNGDTLIINIKNLDGTLTPAYKLRNFTEFSHTMIGRKRLDNLHWCMG